MLHWALDESPHPLIGGPVGEYFWQTVYDVWRSIWPDTDQWEASKMA